MPRREPAQNPMVLVNQTIRSGDFAKVYLLYGGEPYLIRQARDNLKAAILPEDDGMNFSVYHSDQCDEEQIADDIQTLPFLSPHRLILVEDSGFFSKTAEKLAAAIPEIPEGNILIFCESKADQRTKLFKTVKKEGQALDFETPGEAVLQKWIAALLTAPVKERDGMSLKIQNAVPGEILHATGTDMNALANATEKVKSFCLEKGTVTVADVRQMTDTLAEDRIFEMCDAIGAGDRPRALSLYNDLLLLREQPMRILAMINRHYGILTQIRLMTDEKKGTGTMAKVVKIPPFSVRRYQAQAARYSYRRLLRLSDRCQAADLAVKSGRAKDRNALEMLILDLTGDVQQGKGK